jgi:hypothetical protein
MKEQIYTIPVNDAFSEDCECPVCKLESDLESDSLLFMLSPALMEPDNRISTNQKGFCRRHFSMLYEKKENVLGVSLIIDTHIQHQMDEYRKLLKKSSRGIEADLNMSAVKNIAGSMKKSSSAASKFIDEALGFFNELDEKCEVCERIDRIMDRYADVILWMYFKDKDFREKVRSGKGFCLPHYKLLLESAKKHLSPKQAAVFVKDINELMMNNMDRILDEVQWFSQKFDYRNKDASWKNSKDAVPRAISKLVSYGDFK